MLMGFLLLGLALARLARLTYRRSRVKGAWRDNVFVERLWRSVKYEEVSPRRETKAQVGPNLD
jgi:hypothetical protein